MQQGPRLSAGAWSRLTRVCGWCGSTTRDARDPDCDACGGPLAPLPPRILAELDLPVPDWPHPPPAPRRLPRGYEVRIRYTGNTAVLIGIGFCAIIYPSLPFMLATAGSDDFWLMLLAGGFFAVAGPLLWRFGARRASRWLHALRQGHAVEGSIERVFEDTGQSINDTHPWQIDFRFETPAGTRKGFVSSWDPVTPRRQAGERIWVVFDERDPSSSALWPPVW